MNEIALKNLFSSEMINVTSARLMCLIFIGVFLMLTWAQKSFSISTVFRVQLLFKNASLNKLWNSFSKGIESLPQTLLF